MSYHVMEIPRGKYGEWSKVKEELLEALDAEKQGVALMTLIELSDVLGALGGLERIAVDICDGKSIKDTINGIHYRIAASGRYAERLFMLDELCYFGYTVGSCGIGYIISKFEMVEGAVDELPLGDCLSADMLKVSSLILLINLYMRANYKVINIDNLWAMAEVTKRAFKSGGRVSQ